MFTEHLAEDRPVFPLTTRVSSAHGVCDVYSTEHVMSVFLSGWWSSHCRSTLDGISGILPPSAGYFARLFKVACIHQHIWSILGTREATVVVF